VQILRTDPALDPALKGVENDATWLAENKGLQRLADSWGKRGLSDESDIGKAPWYKWNPVTTVTELMPTGPDSFTRFVEPYGTLGSQLFPTQCFVAGTLVLTEEGHKPIEEINGDEFVWSFDEKTGEQRLSRVTKKYVDSTDSTVQIQVEELMIECTPDHPFWIESVGWKPARELQPNFKLKCFDGKIHTVNSVKTHKGKKKVYNLEIQNLHTYFASPISIGVHNRCGK